MCIRFSVRTPACWFVLVLFFVLCRWPSWPVRRALRLLSLISQYLRVTRHLKILSRRRVRKSAFLTFHRVKMDIPKPRGILEPRGSNERSRSPLSIGALRFARGDRKGVVTKVASKTCFIFTAQSRPLARLVQDDGSRKLPQIINKIQS